MIEWFQQLSIFSHFLLLLKFYDSFVNLLDFVLLFDLIIYSDILFSNVCLLSI